MGMDREYTEKLLQAVEEGMLDKDQVILACVKFMSEHQVRAMCEVNDLFPMEDLEDDDYQDPVPDCA